MSDRDCGDVSGTLPSGEPIPPGEGSGKGVYGSGSIGANRAANWSEATPAKNLIPTQTCTVNKNNSGNGFAVLTPIGEVLPPIFISVANTEEYTAPEYHINETGPGNQGEVNYAEYAAQLQAKTLELVSNLQTLRATKAAEVASIPDGPDCDTDVDYPANTFHIEAKTKFEVVPCEDDTIIELYNGTITLTIDGGNLTISGATAVNVVDGELQEGGVRVATRGWVEDSFSENTHTHTFSGSGSDGNTSISISGTTSEPST